MGTASPSGSAVGPRGRDAQRFFLCILRYTGGLFCYARDLYATAEVAQSDIKGNPMGSHKLHKRFVINCSTVGSTQPLTPVNSHIGRSQKLLSSGSTLRILHRDLSMKPHQSGIHLLHWNFVIAIVKLWMVVSGCSESLNSQARCASTLWSKFGFIFFGWGGRGSECGTVGRG